MKRFAICCLAFVIGPLAFPQQPTAWRPNIAEDNKAATWEGSHLHSWSSLFTTRGHNLLVSHDQVTSLELRWTSQLQRSAM